MITMAKKQAPKRSTRSKRVYKQEPVPQAIPVSESKTEDPTVAMAAVETSFVTPPKWRDRLLIFALTLVGTLAGVWIGSSLLATQGTQSLRAGAGE
jgi:hypothetical protein